MRTYILGLRWWQIFLYGHGLLRWGVGTERSYNYQGKKLRAPTYLFYLAQRPAWNRLLVPCLLLTPYPIPSEGSYPPRFPWMLSLFSFPTILLVCSPISSFSSVFVSSQTYLLYSHYSNRVFKQAAASELFRQRQHLVSLIIKSDTTEMFLKITIYQIKWIFHAILRFIWDWNPFPSMRMSKAGDLYSSRSVWIAMEQWKL